LLTREPVRVCVSIRTAGKIAVRLAAYAEVKYDISVGARIPNHIGTVSFSSILWGELGSGRIG